MKIEINREKGRTEENERNMLERNQGGKNGTVGEAVLRARG